MVVNGAGYYEAVKKFGPRHVDVLTFLDNPEKFQFVLFTGGEDISPKLYNEVSPKGFCYGTNERRDNTELAVYKKAMQCGIKMVGICRGLQFLTAMAGGRLIHHTPDHAGNDHLMYLQTSWHGKKQIIVNSLHHQMCLPAPGSYVIGWAPKEVSNDIYYGNYDEPIAWDGPDVEAMYLPSVNSFGVQWHPEFMNESSDAYRWFTSAVDLFLNDEEEFKEIFIGDEEKTTSVAEG